MSVMELGHLLTRSGHTYPEVSSKVCKLGNSVSLPWVICYEAFCLHVVSSSSSIPVICPKLVLFLISKALQKMVTPIYNNSRRAEICIVQNNNTRLILIR
jgi:hypothetical protein